MVVEILNTVLGLNLNENDWSSEGNIISYSYFRADNEWITGKINVYELAYRCKIWAFCRGYELISGTISDENGDMSFECSIYNKNIDTAGDYFLTEFQALNEPETIFKACEYILEMLNK